MKDIRILETVGFFLFLMGAVWQDLRFRGVGKIFLFSFGLYGCVCSLTSGRDWQHVVFSAAVGGVILGISYAARGGIGEGDGWFFVVSGLYLDIWENVLLLLSGLLFASLFGLVQTAVAFVRGTGIQGKSFPFLPCLLPMGLWLILMR